MAIAEWPWPLPYQSERAAMKPVPPDLRRRTEFDSGPARVRRGALVGPWKHPVRWPFTTDEYELFLTFWRESLAEGSAWFNMPILIGPAYVTCECRFTEMFQPAAKGVRMHVDAVLEVMVRPTMSRAEANDRWAGSIA